MSKPIWHVYDCTGGRTISRHKTMAQAGAAYLRALNKPIVARVYMEFPRNVLGFEKDHAMDAVRACSGHDPARRKASLPDRGLYGRNSSTSADIAATLGKR